MEFRERTEGPVIMPLSCAECQSVQTRQLLKNSNDIQVLFIWGVLLLVGFVWLSRRIVALEGAIAELSV